jgi:signal transduction histidine kinase
MHPDIVEIIVTGHASLENAVRALNQGASGYITKPLNIDEVLAGVREALGKQRLVMENRRLYLAALRELQERKRAEKEKRWLQEQLAHAQKMQALGTLVGGLAHEFNNITSAIIGFVELTLQNEKLSAWGRGNLETVLSSASRGADLTRSLLAFSGRDLGVRKAVKLRDVVEEVLRVLEKQLRSEGIELTVKHSPRLPRVMADRGLLSQVVMNLVINAKHAMLKSEMKKLTIQTGLEKKRPSIRIKDAGCGIPREDISRVFEPFFTTKGSLAMGGAYDGKIHGTGLGLSVCHSIVERHGGEITVKSRVGRGTTFTVYIPATSRGRMAQSGL